MQDAYQASLANPCCKQHLSVSPLAHKDKDARRRNQTHIRREGPTAFLHLSSRPTCPPHTLVSVYATLLVASAGLVAAACDGRAQCIMCPTSERDSPHGPKRAIAGMKKKRA